MRKLRNILLLAATISLFTGFSAYAENYWWVNALGEWGYSANDGNLRDGWYWIDGNRDGGVLLFSVIQPADRHGDARRLSGERTGRVDGGRNGPDPPDRRDGRGVSFQLRL